MADRWGYRVAELVAFTGLSRRTVERELDRLSVPMRKVGASVLVEAEAAEAALGFGSSPTEEVPASGEALARARRMLQS